MRKIMSQTRRVAYVAALGGSLLPIVAVTAARADDEVEKKIREEVSRRVSDAVSNRIGDRLSGGLPLQDTLANSFWITASYNDLESDHDSLIEHAGMRFQSDVVNTTFGGDHRFGDSWFVGLSGSYTHADTDSKPIGGGTTTQSENNSYTVSPYAAYVIDPHFFASGLFSYTYSNSESKDDFTGKTNDNSETFATELAANTVWNFGNWLLKGKAGWRFNDAHLFDIDDGNDDFVTNSAVVNAEVGYRFDRFLPYFQAQYEYVWPEKVKGAKSPDPDYVFLTLGVRAAITDNISAGASVKAEVANRETNQLGGAAEFRIRF
ncbi:MAG TPA: autotransporter outer membrane beta-barrel domain-containing protein [Dongiaceae bacterium]|nr:autotransporter outer membrane beta-barrel domain-containing protein [Dongiaceae bacterium]